MPKSPLPANTRCLYPASASLWAKPVIFTGIPDTPWSGFSGSHPARYQVSTYRGLRNGVTLHVHILSVDMYRVPSRLYGRSRGRAVTGPRLSLRKIKAIALTRICRHSSCLAQSPLPPVDPCEASELLDTHQLDANLHLPIQSRPLR